jgi:hypothetical protein
LDVDLADADFLVVDFEVERLLGLLAFDDDALIEAARFDFLGAF